MNDKYNMPLSEMVGFTCTNHTYNIAFAFMARENQDHYEWVVGQLRELFRQVGKRPEAIVTDRELAEMNAIKVLFPDAQNLLCWVHVMRNCAAYAQGLKMSENSAWWFADNAKDIFCSTTEEEYEARCYLLQRKLKKNPRLWNYLLNNWLDPFRDRLVRAYTDHRLNLFSRTTNR